MRFNRSVPIFLSVLLLTAVPVAADIVILKSGEMFQTRQAWRENGQVYYYHNGQLVHVAENQVERLVSSSGPPPATQKNTNGPANVHPAPTVDTSRHREPSGVPATTGSSGFLGLRWGQPVSAFKSLKLVETDPAYGGVEQYITSSREPRFGRASVDNVYYGFWRGSLYTILIEVSNYLDFEDLRSEAFRRYGKGEQPVPGLERFRWQDRDTDRMLSYDNKADTGYLWMRSRAIHAKVGALYPE